MALIGDGRGGVFCANSLALPQDWPTEMQSKVKLGQFDFVVTNPPFGAKIPVKGQELLSQYELGFKWEETGDGRQSRTNELKEDETPQILFIERCVQLLRPGGKMGIVLPEGILGNRGMGYVLDYLRSQGNLIALSIDLPPFHPNTDTKTNVVFFQKTNLEDKALKDSVLFLSVAKTCGHDKRGRPIFLASGEPDDEISDVAAVVRGDKRAPARLCFRKSLSDLLALLPCSALLQPGGQ